MTTPPRSRLCPRFAGQSAFVALAFSLAGCSSGLTNDNPAPIVDNTPCTVTDLIITGDSVFDAGGTLTLTATPTTSNCKTAPAITWASTDSTALSVTSTGVVSAVTASKASISAVAGNAFTSLSVTARRPVITDTRYAYAVADQPTAAAYTAAPGFAYSSSGGAIQFARTGTGAYTATFVGLALPLNPGQQSIQVSATGTAARCKVASTSVSGADLIATVQCYTSTFAAVDNGYDIFVTGSTAMQGRSAFVSIPAVNLLRFWVPLNQAYTSSRGGVQVTQMVPGGVALPGYYVVRFLGMGTPAGGSEVVLSGGGGPGIPYCFTAGWSSFAGDLSVTVSCQDSFQNITTPVSILVYDRGRANHRNGFVFADQPTLASYTPSSSSSYNSNGGTITVTRTSTGVYTVLFAGLARLNAADRETLMLSPFNTANPCAIVGWDPAGAQATVNCFNSAGTHGPVDSRFFLTWIE